MAEERARQSLPTGVFDRLPYIVQETMIEKERRIQELEDIAERERVFKEQEERKERGLAISRQLLIESGVAERVGYTYEPSRLNCREQGHLDISCAFTDIEPNPVSLCGGVVHGFQRSTIESYVPQMQEIWDSANSHDNTQRSATGYVMFHLWSGGVRRYGTRAIGIYGNIKDRIEDLYLALDVLIKDIEKAKHGYSDIYDNLKDNYLHLYFKANYYPEPSSVTNWGDDIKEVEKRKSFNIFTANDVNKSCAIQVAQRLWTNSEITTLEEIITKASPNLCIVKPHISITNIRYINDYSDLVIDINSPIKTLSVIDPDAIYLLHYDGHLGIIEDLKPQVRNNYFTSFRPLIKFPYTKKITMCFDIECYFDPKNDQRHIPYLCCACFVYDVGEKHQSIPGNVMEFEGKDCVAQMIDYAADTVKGFNLSNIELIAHNGGGYDFHYLLTSMYDPSIINNILIRNSNFISFKFKHCNVTFTVKDSLNFLQCSLQNAAKAFLNETDRKTDFPHHEVRTQDDLQRVFNEWVSVDDVLDVNVEKEKIIINNKHIVNYKTNGDAKTLMDWSKEYCCNDVIVLAKVWIRFKQTVFDVFNCHIVDQTMTLAGMSFRLFEANLPKTLDTHSGHGSIRLHHPSKIEYNHMKQSLIGGRCISVNGIYEDVVCLDVKSLYPAAMAYYDQPYGNYRLVTGEIENELGIFYCKVQPIHIDGHGFFPLKSNGNVVYSSGVKDTKNTHTVLEEYTAWYTSIDILIGREEGHTIIPIAFDDKHVGYSWKHKGLIFKEYIEGVLYKLKLYYENTEQMEQRWIVKIIMNSLWGKFAQKWMDSKYIILNESNCDMINDVCNKIFDTNYFLIERKQDNMYSSKPIQNGIFTLSYARYHMYNLWKQVVKPGTVCLYSDTDSMMFKKEDLIEDASVIGKDMGQLEIEYIFEEFICVGKKQYIGKYGNKYKKRFKGVPQQYITPSLFTHLIKSVDNEARINFLKFRREWGCIHGYIESKTVKQT